MADEMTVEVMPKNHMADDFAETVREHFCANESASTVP